MKTITGTRSSTEVWLTDQQNSLNQLPTTGHLFY